jgi:hypothetical protein
MLGPATRQVQYQDQVDMKVFKKIQYQYQGDMKRLNTSIGLVVST